MVDKLLQNPLVKTVLLKQLKSVFNDGNIKTITIRLVNGEIDVQTHADDLLVINETKNLLDEL